MPKIKLDIEIKWYYKNIIEEQLRVCSSIFCMMNARIQLRIYDYYSSSYKIHKPIVYFLYSNV